MGSSNRGWGNKKISFSLYVTPFFQTVFADGVVSFFQVFGAISDVSLGVSLYFLFEGARAAYHEIQDNKT